MHIIKVEVPEDNGVGVCENCHANKPVRPVESIGLAKESRGWFNICFDCFGPQVWWCEREGGKVWVSPARLTQRAPDVCPVCNGKGSIRVGVYSENCEACNGTGKRR